MSGEIKSRDGKVEMLGRKTTWGGQKRRGEDPTANLVGNNGSAPQGRAPLDRELDYVTSLSGNDVSTFLSRVRRSQSRRLCGSRTIFDTGGWEGDAYLANNKVRMNPGFILFGFINGEF